MFSGGVIIAALGGGVLMTVLAYTWRLGAKENRELLLTISLFLAVVLLSGCASSDPWTRTDSVMYGAYVTTLVTDGHTTSQFRRCETLEEAGLIARSVLGNDPRESDTWQYMATLAITNYFIARALPSELRKVWLGANTIGHGYASVHNFGILSEARDTGDCQ